MGTVTQDGDEKSGGVKEAIKKWLLYEDELMASRMQEAEINNHHEQNRLNRRTVREDIPVAKEAFSEEQARDQCERMRQLEENRRVAEQDADMALQLQERLAMDRGRTPPQYPANDATTLQSGGVTQEQQIADANNKSNPEIEEQIKKDSELAAKLDREERLRSIKPRSTHK